MRLRGVAFSPDGKRLASASDDGTVKLWDMATGLETLTLRCVAGYCMGVAFSPDGSRIAAAGTPSVVNIWDARPWTPELREEQEALGLVRLHAPSAPDTDGLLARIRAETAVSESVRAKSIEFAREWPVGQRGSSFFAHVDRGRSCLKQGRSAEATEAFVAALDTMPDGRDVYDARSEVDMLVASSDEVFRRVNGMRPDDHRLWTARGRYLAWLARWPESAGAYVRGSAGETFAFDWLECACALTLAGDGDGYRRICQRTTEWFHAAGAQEVAHREWPRRLHEAVRLVALQPDSSIDTGVMLRWADEALKGWPDHNIILYAAGAAYSRAGRYDLAVELLERSVKIDPNWSFHALTKYRLAIAHYHLGHKDEARRWFDMAETWVVAKEKVAAAEATRFPPADHIVDYLEAQVLRCQARALLDLDPVRDKPGR